ncbi:DNA (cytosine-5)-methyltransferase 1 [Mesorhizobium sp. J18]|uniref:DNA cytosine methyltransferase n=1 Tax=Mesorhizobium sp. J18 TaxID=935263 RepID=UPI00119C67BC|nr:DNA cytosine methyltransferase [Mesorhizobium sp. J18]TWG90342.1 DNA (cytosine-5)-methyltransferase 1 [Mesorhizobium sp. J18]
MMRYGSVCSGIEAATVAWEPLGWQAEFYSEIEAFPSHVLHEHYSSGRPQFMPDPDEPGLKPKDRKARAAAIKAVSRLPERANGVPNHGDMTQFEEWPDHAIDLLVGGTPCQSYSIAGLRKGLDDPRGDLMLTYAAIARRYRPRWLVWENVFGVLSSKGGRDFASLLGLLSGRRVEVPADGWKSAGIVEGYGGAYGLAWRVLDTQYVRVDGAPRALPQRRRRVFVVGHSGGDWRRAAAVLFERDGLSGNPAPRRETGKGIAPTISARPTGGGGLGTDFDLDGGVIIDDAARCVTAGYAQRLDWETENFVAHVAPTMRAGGNQTGGDRPYGTDVDTCDSLVAHSLRPEGFDASEDRTGRGTPLIPVSVAIRGRDEGGAIEMGDDVAHALRASQGGGDKPHVLAPVAYSIMPQNSGKEYNRSGPLGSSSPQAQAIAFAQNSRDEVRLQNGDGSISGALAAEAGMKQTSYVAYPLDLRNAGRDPDKRDAQNRQGLGVGDDGDPAHTLTSEFVPGVATQWAVRRLTPTECARLQGFPDNHCRIPWRGKPAEECPDGPQYKAYGNSMSTNVMRWLGERIQTVDAITERGRAAA